MEHKKEQTMREWMDSQSYADQKAVIQEEINSNKLEIDRSCFAQNDEERGKTETAKYHWRQMIKKQGFSKRKVPVTFKTKI